MTAHIIDGTAFALDLRGRVAAGAAKLAANGLVPGLAVVLVGEDPASQVYVASKERETVAAGMRSFAHKLPASTTQTELLALVRRLNADKEVHGILVQMPLPAQIDSGAIVDAIDPAKDVDGLHPYSAGRLAQGLPSLVPCTPAGCLMLIKDVVRDLAGLDAVVIGRSILVGRPMAALLIAESCTVTVAHSKTRDLPTVCRRADILVAAVGRPHFVRGDWVKPGAIVIDVGINRVPGAEPGKTKLVGDVLFDEAKDIAKAITPVPRGVGPMTIACLLRNTVLAACAQTGRQPPQM